MSKNIIFTIFTLWSFLVYPVFSMYTYEEQLDNLLSSTNDKSPTSPGFINFLSNLINMSKEDLREELKDEDFLCYQKNSALLLKNISHLYNKVGESWFDEYFSNPDENSSSSEEYYFRQENPHTYIKSDQLKLDKKSNIIINAANFISALHLLSKVEKRTDKKEEAISLLGKHLLSLGAYRLPTESQSNALASAISIIKNSDIEKLLINSNLKFKGEDFKEIRKGSKYKIYSKGQAICHKGEDADSFILIVDGSLSVRNEANEELVVLGKGELLGELGMVGDSIRTATLIAKEKTEILFISYNKMKRFLKSKPEKYKKLLKTMASRYVKTIAGKTAKDVFALNNLPQLHNIFNNKIGNQYEKDELINKPGLYRIEQGEVRIKKNDNVIGRKQVGDIFGADTLFSIKDAGSSVYFANDNTTVTFINKGEVFKEADSAPDLYDDLFCELAALTKRANSLVVKEVKEILNSINLFNNSTINKILKFGNYEFFGTDEIICEQGDISDSLFVVVKGEVSVFVDNKEVASIGKGAVLGEMGFINKDPRSATLKAKKNTKIYVISYDSLEQVLSDNTDEYLKLFNAIVKKIINTEIGRDCSKNKSKSILIANDHNWVGKIFDEEAIKYEKGSEISRKGIFYLDSGEVYIEKNMQRLGKKTLGSFFGIDNLAEGIKKDEKLKYIAHTDVTVSFIERKNALNLIKDNPERLKNLLNEALSLTNRANSLVVSKFISLLRPKNTKLEEEFISVTYNKGDIICKQGDASTEAYFIRRGSVAVKVNNKTVANLEEGDLIGEMGLARKETRSATLVANKRTKVLILPYEKIESILKTKKGVLELLLKDMALKIQKTQISKANENGLSILTPQDADNIANYSKKIINSPLISAENLNHDNNEGFIFFLKKGHVFLNKTECCFGRIFPGTFFGLDNLAQKNIEDIMYSLKGDVEIIKIPIKKLKLHKNTDLGWILFQQMSDIINRLNSLK